VARARVRGLRAIEVELVIRELGGYCWFRRESERGVDGTYAWLSLRNKIGLPYSQI
jgi:hypothetical protein